CLLRLAGIAFPEPHDKAGTATGILLDSHRAGMQFHDLLDDGEAKARTASSAVAAMPEPVEDVLTVLGSNACPAITDADAAIGHLDLDRRWGATVDDGVLDQVADTVFNGVHVALDHHRCGASELDVLALGDRQWRHVLHYVQCHHTQIHVRVGVHLQAVEPRHM